jgi:hypothetical protein
VLRPYPPLLTFDNHLDPKFEKYLRQAIPILNTQFPSPDGDLIAIGSINLDHSLMGEPPLAMLFRWNEAGRGSPPALVFQRKWYAQTGERDGAAFGCWLKPTGDYRLLVNDRVSGLVAHEWFHSLAITDAELSEFEPILSDVLGVRFTFAQLHQGGPDSELAEIVRVNISDSAAPQSRYRTSEELPAELFSEMTTCNRPRNAALAVKPKFVELFGVNSRHAQIRNENLRRATLDMLQRPAVNPHVLQNFSNHIGRPLQRLSSRERAALIEGGWNAFANDRTDGFSLAAVWDYPTEPAKATFTGQLLRDPQIDRNPTRNDAYKAIDEQHPELFGKYEQLRRERPPLSVRPSGLPIMG